MRVPGKECSVGGRQHREGHHLDGASTHGARGRGEEGIHFIHFFYEFLIPIRFTLPLQPHRFDFPTFTALISLQRKVPQLSYLKHPPHCPLVELIANHRSFSEIAAVIGAEAVFYNSLQDLEDAVRALNPALKVTFIAVISHF